jgi:hypothetical protein
MYKRFENDNPFMPWNSEFYRDDLSKMWNSPMYRDDPYDTLE